MTETTTSSHSIPCTQLKGVGPKLAQRLAKLGIHDCQDLLFHLPSRYQDRTRITPIADCRVGDAVVIEGTIIASSVMYAKRRVWICRCQDASGSLLLTFFHFNQTQRSRLRIGQHVRCYGEVRFYRNQHCLTHPEYQFVHETSPPVAEYLTPLYPTADGISQHLLRDLINQALELNQHQEFCSELLPAALRHTTHDLTLSEALQIVHRPPPDIDIEQLTAVTHPACRRLVFEELLANRLALGRVRQQIQRQKAAVLRCDDNMLKPFLAQLPFSMTSAQQRCCQHIRDDLAKPIPMMRLIQGDVGSGKTVVAAYAAMIACATNHQVALMAPTEILAEQHYHTFSHWLSALGLRVMLLTGKTRARDRREILQWLAEGEIHCLIGTHALFQADVVFTDLGLVMIDEQHRFGVHQRLALQDKANHGQHPHQLVLTATPIPRSLAMTAYADLDISVIDELPPGRLPVKTVVMANTKRDTVTDRIATVIAAGRQVYWVCTLIEESEQLQAKAAEHSAAELAAALPNIRLALLHGRMPKQDKEHIMTAFKAGHIDLLVATTVIEVGVDVPNASLMVIENAERLGLAQLHQLRGRVGRGDHESFCVLLYQSPLSEQGQARLAIMRETNDGFKIANKDLELRGPGEVLGTKQTGLVKMRIADVLRDQALLPAVKQAATIIQQDFPTVIPTLIARWLGDKEKYSKV